MVKILVTGANGQLGNEINHLSKEFGDYDFLFADIDELDLCDKEALSSYISKNKPKWIINCAAYNAVDKAETDMESALKVNQQAVKNIVSAIKGTDTKFIHVSTDYVFDGMNNVPYNENDEPNPSTAYGFSKRQGEIEALKHDNSIVIRTAWLYSSYGANFVKTIIKKGEEKGLLKVVYDQVGTPTYARDLAKAILSIINYDEIGKISFKPGIYHFSDEGVCSWYDFAVAIIEEAQINCSVLPILSSEYDYKTKRPAFSVLNKQKIKETYNIVIPYWRDSLKECIKQLRKI